MKIFPSYMNIVFFAISFFVKSNKVQASELEFEKQSEVGWQVDSLIQQSNFYLKDNLQNSLAFALNALEVSLQTNNKYDLLNAYNQIGKVYFYVGMFENCYINWQKAHRLAIEISNEAEISNTSFNLAALFIALEEIDKAQDYINRVKPYYFSIDSPDYVLKQLNVINNQALIHQKKGQIALAQSSFDEGIKLEERLTNKADAITFLNAYSSFLLEKKDFSTALKTLHYIQELNSDSSTYNVQVDATTHYRFASIYHELDKNSKVKYHLSIGMELAKSVNSVTLLKQFNYFLYQLSKNTNEGEKALMYKERYDSLFKIEQINESKLAIVRDDLEEQYTNFKTQLESEVLKRKRQKTIIYSTLLCILILLFILILRTKKQQTEKHFAKRNLNNLKNKVATTQKEIVALELKQIEQSAMFKKIISDLQSNSLLKKTHVDDRKQLKLLNNQTKALWKEFEFRFNQIDHGFYEKLDATCQELTNKERRLCALIRLDFSSKEIATINNQTLRSVEIARTRIRKKLKLTNTKTKFDVFLKQL